MAARQASFLGPTRSPGADSSQGVVHDRITFSMPTLVACWMNPLVTPSVPTPWPPNVWTTRPWGASAG